MFQSISNCMNIVVFDMCLYCDMCVCRAGDFIFEKGIRKKKQFPCDMVH